MGGSRHTGADRQKEALADSNSSDWDKRRVDVRTIVVTKVLVRVLRVRRRRHRGPKDVCFRGGCLPEGLPLALLLPR